MSAETIYKEIMKQFNSDVIKAVSEACQSVQGEIIPYINDDTEYNAVERAADMVRKIINGNFTIEDGFISVDGGYLTKITSNDHDKLVDVLTAKAGDKAKDLKIERLERLLADSYSNNW